VQAWRELLKVAGRLKFERHDIRAQLDETGRCELTLEREFPFAIRLFRFTSKDFTRGVTWHERLELFLPLDGRVYLRMGERTVRLDAGDLLHVRLAEAARLLKHSDESIAAIARRVGFSDQSYFDRCFKRAFAQTPRQFRGS